MITTGDEKTMNIVDYLCKIVTRLQGPLSRLISPVDMSLGEAPIHFHVYLIDDRCHSSRRHSRSRATDLSWQHSRLNLLNLHRIQSRNPVLNHRRLQLRRRVGRRSCTLPVLTPLGAYNPRQRGK